MGHAKSTDPNVFILPDLGEGVHEAELISWKVEPGQTVKEHEILAEMETDKALVEVPSPRAGTIKTLHGSEGEILHVGNPLVTYEGGDEAHPNRQQAILATEETSSGHMGSNGTGEREDAGTVVGKVGDATPGIGSGDGKALAAPAVRRLARDLGIDINSVIGTGIAGRVTAKDVRAAAEGSAPTKASGSPAPSTASSGSSSQGQPAATRTPMPSAPHANTQQSQSGGRPMPQPTYQQPAYQPQGQPQGGYAQPAYPQTGYPQAPGYGYPPPMPFGYMPMPMMPYPMPCPGYGMPMPGGFPGGVPGGMPAGLPAAPGYSPSAGGRPIPDPAQQSMVQPGQAEGRTPFRGVRRTIAEKLRESVNTAVHFTVVDEADVTALDDLRRRYSEQTGQKISFLPFVCAAVTRALSPLLGGRFGALNARVDDDAGEVVQHAAVHLGIAADTDSGLMVPVVRDAQGMNVAQLGGAIADIAKAARDRSIPREQLMGSTFTISNVGSHAGKFATPVINYPEVGILAVGKVYDGVVVRDGQAMVGKLMPLSLACDHRVVDGATAALALAEIVKLLSTECESLV
jgi:pyruvate dehydrogenase E2 component (dihydrolipoamide acetyltransferase)